MFLACLCPFIVLLLVSKYSLLQRTCIDQSSIASTWFECKVVKTKSGLFFRLDSLHCQSNHGSLVAPTDWWGTGATHWSSRSSVQQGASLHPLLTRLPRRSVSTSWIVKLASWLWKSRTATTRNCSFNFTFWTWVEQFFLFGAPSRPRRFSWTETWAFLQRLFQS